MIITVISAAISQRQLFELIHQNSIAFSQSRPWIKIESINLRAGHGPSKTLMFHWPEDSKLIDPQLQAEITLRNVGHSVAQNVQIFPVLYFAEFSSDGWSKLVAEKRKSLCQINVNRESSGKIIFPDDSSKIAFTAIGANPGMDSAAAVLVCVFYSDNSGASFRTELSAGLYERNNAIINSDIDTDSKDLKLIYFEEADNAF